MKKLHTLGVLLLIISQSPAVRGDVECIEQPNGKEPLCLELGGSTNPVKPVVVKPGKGCGTNSACGGNMKVGPDKSTPETEKNGTEAIELAPQFGGKQGANPAYMDSPQ